MTDWHGWGWSWDGWLWDWSGWGWGGSGQDWTGGSWQQDQRGSALAGSAGDDATINPQAILRQDQERRNLGLTGAWVDWDVHEFRRLVAALPEAGSDAKESIGLVRPSRRHTQLGKAFQNYRRHTLDKLKKTRNWPACSRSGGLFQLTGIFRSQTSSGMTVTCMLSSRST